MPPPKRELCPRESNRLGATKVQFEVRDSHMVITPEFKCKNCFFAIKTRFSGVVKYEPSLYFRQLCDSCMSARALSSSLRLNLELVRSDCRYSVANGLAPPQHFFFVKSKLFCLGVICNYVEMGLASLLYTLHALV